MSAMYNGLRKYTVTLVAAGLYFFSQVACAVLFEPGIGLGLEYTDNATLTPEATVEDLITVGYVGARLSENEGSLKYDVSAAFNKQNYVRDTYEDQRYFNLGARADWEMIRERFNWFLSNRYSQVPVVSTGSNTPDNIQDSNAFTFGADIQVPISARQSFSLVPMFSQYYYEVLLTDNKQYSLAANWNYQMFRLTNVGLSLSTRTINYTETDLSGRSIEDTTFTTLGFTFNGQRSHSSFAGSLGSTNVSRENGDETTGFSGFLNWVADLSSRSTFNALISTDLTDTSTVSSALAEDPTIGNPSDVQITADVVRTKLISLAYLREDGSLNSSISANYNELDYSESPLDRFNRGLRAELNYPITQLLSGGTYVDYRYTKQFFSGRIDEDYLIGGNLNYRFTRKLNSVFDVKYRRRESNNDTFNYKEFSVFASLVYGFGNVQRPTRAGGY
jgi:hypothetical protein